MSEGNIKYNQRLYFAPSDKSFHQVHLKSEVWKYFKRNTNNECRCNLCGAVYMQLGQSTSNMFKHLNVSHGQEVFGFYRVKKVEEGIFTDFIEDIVANGYPAQIFLEALMKLFNCYEDDFHEIVDKASEKIVECREQITNFLEDIDIFVDEDQAKQIIRQKFPKISEGSRKIILDENFWMYGQDTDIIARFDKFGYHIHTQCEMKNIISNMLLITDSMKQAYYKFGDNILVNPIDKVFKKRSPRGFDQISCWFITGYNQKLQIVLFGFALISQATTDSYDFIFRKFFKQMNQYHPHSICTPQLSKLQKKLRQICPKTAICTNWYHKLTHLKALLQSERQGQIIMKSMCQMLRTPCQQEYEIIKKNIISKIADQEIIKLGIDYEKQKHCITKIHSLIEINEKGLIQKKFPFLGFGIEAKQYLQIENLVRRQFIYQQNLARLFLFALSLDKKINYQFKNISYHQNQRQMISENLHDSILNRWNKSLNQENELILEPQSQIMIRIFQKYNKKQKKIYTVKYLLEHDHWVCNCGYLGITGLPCKHLMAVIDIMKGSIDYYINPRWIVLQNEQNYGQQVKIIQQN